MPSIPCVRFGASTGNKPACAEFGTEKIHITSLTDCENSLMVVHREDNRVHFFTISIVFRSKAIVLSRLLLAYVFAACGVFALSLPAGVTLRCAEGPSSSNVTLSKPNAPTISAQGTKSAAASSAHSRRQEEPFECTGQVTDASGLLSYTSQFLLSELAWTGGAEAECTILMASISFSVSAIHVHSGESSVIAEGVCEACADLVAVSTGFTCTQAPVQGNCDGEWQVSESAVFVAPPDFVFISGEEPCVAEAEVLTCEATFDAGQALLFNLPDFPLNLPAGVEDPPVLDNAAIGHIRDRHFDPVDDPNADVFASTLTDGDIGQIFITGLTDPRIEWFLQDGAGQNPWRGEFSFTAFRISDSGQTAVSLVTDGLGLLAIMFPHS
ncbi:hypothetical protein C8J57DRAFT_1522944 [Mycena rebaudengoi]|nr:hypothetical protein C8J57DRAFT_1522944 [Mycena rebaudengoi]